MTKVAAAGETTKGIDVSHWQFQIDWEAVKKAGYDFAFIKSSEGLTKLDNAFKSHWTGIKGNGILRGAYHYFHPSLDPYAQARLFITTIGTLDSSDLPCVMDWEVTDGIPSDQDLENGLKFLNEVELLTNIRPIIYSGPYFLNALKLSSDFKRFSLWVAHYGVSAPLVPSPWDTWAFWQSSGGKSGISVPGVGACDVDMFNGTLEQLKSGVF